MHRNNNQIVLHLRSLIYSLIFLIGMEIISMTPFYLFKINGNVFLFGRDINLVLTIVSTILFFLSIYSGWRVGKKVIFSFVNLGLFTFASILILHFIDNYTQKYLFAFMISLAFYSTLLGAERLKWNKRDLTARSIFSSAFIAMLFMFFATMYGFYINFVISLWIMMLINFLFCGFATYTSLLVHSKDKKRLLLYSTVISFSVIQFVWVANFWPFGYLTMATSNLVFYYVLWDLVQMLFLKELSKKRVLLNIIFCLVLIILVLFTSKWKLI